ncbi:unknown protein [Simkania negevensis Z]|uniref:Uncharacterized protein n=1 Tax=Simkania negevensis (strain ATCC VR-1471 / DSM 27360 / Z) TaxID=331113 RepID=F8L505_SIMNZ|nr:unknown protein [Simkania negevensis Z]
MLLGMTVITSPNSFNFTLAPVLPGLRISASTTEGGMPLGLGLFSYHHLLNCFVLK